MKKIFFAVMMIAALSVINANVSTGTARASSTMHGRIITDAQVIVYLLLHGYSLISILETQADGTRICSTSHVGYYCHVYLNTEQTAIVGHEEFPQ